MRAKHAKRILLGITPDSIPVLSPVLSTRFELLICTSLDEARSGLVDEIDLLACDAHFDDCRMFDLLRLSKADPVTRPIPFLCMRIIEGELDQALYQSAVIASHALGAAGFVDLFRLKQKYGAEEAHEKLRNLIAQLASPSSDF